MAKVAMKCEMCGHGFNAVSPSAAKYRKHCSKVCMHKAMSDGLKIPCLMCGKVVGVWKSSNRKYCSLLCYYERCRLKIPVTECKNCGKRFRQRTVKENRKFCSLKCRDLWVPPQPTSKGCSVCKLVKLASAFKKTNQNKVGLLAACIECDKKRRLAFGVKERLKKLGLTQSDYGVMFKSQEGSCAICDRRSTEIPNGKLVVDHNHATGEVRKLLCIPCNLALGQFRDSKALLQKAINYLVVYGGSE